MDKLKIKKYSFLFLCAACFGISLAVGLNYQKWREYSMIERQITATEEMRRVDRNSEYCDVPGTQAAGGDFIKWVDFNVTYKALARAMEADIKRYGTSSPMPWISSLSILACKYGGDFSQYKQSDFTALEKKVAAGQNLDDIGKELEHYTHYKDAYGSVLGGFLGEYSTETPNINNPQVLKTEKKYGLKVFSPVAGGYNYAHYDDFGAKRTYGFKRSHLGHDMMGAVGTPIVAVESGVVEAVGWNQYGGWRIGIRSFDGKRYYYYSHLRKGHPYNKNIEVGAIVMAGDVIGYMGMTGYSIKSDVNNINVPHLHWGMQLIFDQSQKDAVSEIWIDLYAITELLSNNSVRVYKDSDTKEYNRKYKFSEKVPDEAKLLAEKFAEEAEDQH